ncbi:MULTISPECIES: MerR family transcriptional regulator [unclassified Microbacterium]|uniref:MerR family transcriptional regulator n=1 Tax=unclassified Microbacterium TaxID=2609290 RepID=UPI0012F84094|nr:MerR family transcriptional regulator [Microbacterium sp. MAH-37]MVQ41310.1 MerR family transcriptional regulator [Microbacterium sp. MAH-37]
MLSIGAFAQIGQVTHRMLRHWDTEGLLVPAHVDEFSGYRSYDPSQLATLHRIVALRQLGFGLDDVSSILEEGASAERLAELLGERRAEVEEEHRIAAARLVDVERRLRLITEENHMSRIETIEKSLPAVRLAARTAVAPDQPSVGPLVGPLFDAVADALAPTGAPLRTPIATYEAREDGTHMVVGFAYAGDPVEGVEIIELPAVASAVCAVHLGTMDGIADSWMALHEEILGRGSVPSGPCRELYLRSESEDQRDWVTELQQPVASA